MATPAPDRSAEPVPTLERAYREHADDAWRLARLLGVRHAHLDDVVHEVFLVVHRRLPDFDPARSLKRWIAGITRNVVLHNRRQHARRERRIELVPAPSGAPSQPDDEIARLEAAQAFEAFLATVEHRKREVFVLFEVEGMSARAISDLTHTNINTVFTRLRAARKSFERFVAARENNTRGRHYG